MKRTAHQLVHGYNKGHSLLAGSCSLPKKVSEIITELSDLSGPVPAGVSIPPHLTVYAVPDTEFYAVGRSWADNDAPRTGCVITHTLLIPMHSWESVAYPAVYLHLLRRPTRHTLDMFRKDVPLPEIELEPQELEWLTQPVAEELVRKIFSQDLRTVLWCDCKDPDMIVMSLASLLWPALRRTFYAHTFSLHGNAKVWNDLQLHFAPRSALSYFSRLPKQCLIGRDIAEAGNDTEQEWVQNLSRNLRTGGANGAYRSLLNRYGHLLDREPSAVRNLFAIRDLSDRLSLNPAAAIGILDILDSLQPAPEQAIKEKESAVSAAVSSAIAADASTKMRCLYLIDARLHRMSFAQVGGSVSGLLRASVEEIVAVAPEILIETCGNGTPSKDSSFWLGAVDGLKIAASSHSDSVTCLAKSPSIAAFALGIVPRIAVDYLRSSHHDKVEVIRVMIEWLRNMPRGQHRHQLRVELLPEICSDDTIPLLEELLRDLCVTDVSETMDTLADVTRGFESASARRVVSEQVCQRFPEEVICWGQHSNRSNAHSVPRIIAEAFPVSLEGLDRVLATRWRSTDDRCEVWAAFVERSAEKKLPQWFVRRASNDVALLEPFVSVSQLSKRAKQALIVIGGECDYLPLVRLRNYQQFLQNISGSELGPMYVSKTVDSAVAEYVVGRIDENQLIEGLTLQDSSNWVDSAPSNSVFRRLQLLEDCDEWQRAMIAASVLPPVLFRKLEGDGSITDLIRSNLARWNDVAASAWARYVKRAGNEFSAESALRVQVEATSFCFKNPWLPVNPVVLEAFPPLYAAVSVGIGESVTGEMFGYFEWDKAKKLRKELIDAFVSSRWPPGMLLIIASRSYILGKVIHRLLRKLTGEDFLKRAMRDLQNLGTQEAQSTLVEVSAIINDPDFFEPWD